MSNDRHATRPIVLLALALLTFLPFLGRRDVVTSHEARVIQTSRQMAESGWPWNATPVTVTRSDGARIDVNPWIIPVMNGEIRLQKPPLPYWVSAAVYRCLRVGAATSRLVPALMGAFSVLLVWDVARRTLGRTGAWYAALVWVSTYFIVDEFRKSMADPYLAMLTLGCIWAWIRATTALRLIVFYAMLSLGLLAKGPLILIFLLVTLSAYHLCYRRSVPGSVAGHLAGILLLLAICLPWTIAVLRSVPNVLEQWRYESAGAFSDKTDNARPIWFYLPNLLLITLPWMPVWLIGLWLPFRYRQRRRLFAIAVTVAIVTIFSLSLAKKNAYLLPLMPVIAIATADGLRWIAATWRPRRIAGVVTILAVAFSVLTQVAIAFETAKDNRRSPKKACQLVRKLLADSPRIGLMASSLPDEATVYLPLNIQTTSFADAMLVILDNRKRDAAERAKQIRSTPAGAVETVELLSDPAERFQVYRLIISPVQSATPGAGQVLDKRVAVHVRHAVRIEP